MVRDEAARAFKVGQRVRPTLKFFKTLGKGGRKRAITGESQGTVIRFGVTKSSFVVKWDTYCKEQVLHQKYITVINDDGSSGRGDS